MTFEESKKILEDAVKPLLERLDAAEAEAREYRDRYDNLQAAQNAEALKARAAADEALRIRFRVSLANDLVAASIAAGSHVPLSTGGAYAIADELIAAGAK